MIIDLRHCDQYKWNPLCANIEDWIVKHTSVNIGSLFKVCSACRVCDTTQPRPPHFWFSFSMNHFTSLMFECLFCVSLVHSGSWHADAWWATCWEPACWWIWLIAKQLHQQKVLGQEINVLFEVYSPPVCYIMQHCGADCHFEIKPQVN